MGAELDSYYNLVERVEDTFSEIDSDVCVDLRKSDSEYAKMWRAANQMQQDYPVIVKLLESSGPVSLTADEHEALLRYFDLQRQLEDMERREIYFRGHADNFAYLKKIGAV